MSNQLYMDESNGNGFYAAKSNSSGNDNEIGVAVTATTNTAASAASASSNNIGIMNGSAAATVAAAAAVVAATLPTSLSSEDLSQSLSEYTDADESISAPTEFLAEFLSAVMLKDYKKALKYCKLILQYEPNNATAKEFYPLILEKLRVAASSDSDENYNKSSSPDVALEQLQCSEHYPSAGESDEAGSDGPNSQHDSEEPLSLSECDDDVDDDDIEDNVEDDDDIEDVDEDNEDDDDVMSSSGDDDLPIDEQPDVDADAVAAGGLAVTSHNGSGSSRNSSSGGGGRSDNTTHSYSSLLLEEEDDIVPVTLNFCTKDATTAVTDLDVSNGNKVPSASCSDSESPTEPLTQRLAAILRSKCGVSSGNDDHY